MALELLNYFGAHFHHCHLQSFLRLRETHIIYGSGSKLNKFSQHYVILQTCFEPQFVA